MKKILVTGGLGFIGSHFIIKGIKEGFEIINLDNETYAANRQNVKDIEESKNYKLIKGDICNDTLVKEIFSAEKFDTIVNFAAESHVDRSIENPDIFIKTNVSGTNVLLRNSVEFGINKFLQVSTDEVYGHLSLGEPAFTEKTPLHPRSPYSASKASADLLALSYKETYGLNVIITRCSNNFGPHQDKSKLIPVIVGKAIKNERIPIYGQGENIRDWIYVCDHVNGIFQALHKGISGEIYNFGGNMEITNLELCKKILDYLGKKHDLIEFVKDRKGHDFRYAIDDTKSKNMLFWNRIGNFENNLQNTIEYLINFHK